VWITVAKPRSEKRAPLKCQTRVTFAGSLEISKFPVRLLIFFLNLHFVYHINLWSALWVREVSLLHLSTILWSLIFAGCTTWWPHLDGLLLLAVPSLLSLSVYLDGLLSPAQHILSAFEEVKPPLLSHLIYLEMLSSNYHTANSDSFQVYFRLFSILSPYGWFWLKSLFKRS
jgi:hypothetical protein